MIPQTRPVVYPETCDGSKMAVFQSLLGCTRAEILTYSALALHADPNGHCWPSREQLSLITHLNKSQISKATSGLERKGLIRKEINSGNQVDYYLLPQKAKGPFIAGQHLPTGGAS